MPTLATQQKNVFLTFFIFLFVNWAGQISAGQAGPKKSKFKSYKFFIADLAK